MDIYISGLHSKINDADLKTLFEEYGPISSAKVIMDNLTGKSRCFGFVKLDNDIAARKALMELNGTFCNGHTLAVSEAKIKNNNIQNSSKNRKRKV